MAILTYLNNNSKDFMDYIGKFRYRHVTAIFLIGTIADIGTTLYFTKVLQLPEGNALIREFFFHNFGVFYGSLISKASAFAIIFSICYCYNQWDLFYSKSWIKMGLLLAGYMWFSAGIWNLYNIVIYVLV